MPKTYSYDLRQKVIQAIEIEGYKKIEVVYGLSSARFSINLWLRRRDETGDFQAFSSRPKTAQSLIKNWVQFRDFVKANSVISLSPS